MFKTAEAKLTNVLHLSITAVHRLHVHVHFEFRILLSRFGRGDTRVRGSFNVSTNNFDKIAKFISTCNAMYGMFKL